MNMSTITSSSEPINKVLKNTYQLLAMTLLFSAFMCGIGMLIGIPHTVGIVLSLLGLGLLFYISMSSVLDSPKALPLTFLFTGIQGMSLAPIISHYIASSGGAILLQSLTGTAVIFMALSGYVLYTKKDFSFLRGFLFVGLVGVVVAMLGLLVYTWIFGSSFQTAMVSVGISYIVVMVMSGFILVDTSDIINGIETNYVRACIGLYLNIINIFVHLLNILNFADD